MYHDFFGVMDPTKMRFFRPRPNVTLALMSMLLILYGIEELEAAVVIFDLLPARPCGAQPAGLVGVEELQPGSSMWPTPGLAQRCCWKTAVLTPPFQTWSFGSLKLAPCNTTPWAHDKTDTVCNTVPR